jgi:hypothetical protein
VLKYLARYTHRVAISNHRLRALENGRVSFEWKDYAHHSQRKIMTLDALEFIRRFLLHVLPSGLVRIRQFGFLANRFRTSNLRLCRELLAVCQTRPPAELLILSDWQARAVDQDRSHPPPTVSRHVMTRSRDLSSSSFYSPSRASANPCPYIGTMRLQLFAAALWTPFMVARSPRTTPTVPLQAFWAPGSTAKPHSIPSSLVRLSSMNSIGSAHAGLMPTSPNMLPREHSR